MAVVVIKWFFRSKKTAKERLSYIAGRPGKEKEDMARPLFGFGGQMSREQAERMIANAPKGTIFFRKRSRGKPVENQRLNFLAFAHRLY
jgi:hypothetical protein